MVRVAHSLKISLNLEENISPYSGSLVFIKLIELRKSFILEQICFLINESNLHCVDLESLTGPTALPEVTDICVSLS